MSVIRRDEPEPCGPWTLRTRGWGIMPEVVAGFGFERPERIEVVPADQLRGAVEALKQARSVLVTDTATADDRVRQALRIVNAALGGQSE